MPKSRRGLEGSQPSGNKHAFLWLPVRSQGLREEQDLFSAFSTSELSGRFRVPVLQPSTL